MLRGSGGKNENIPAPKIGPSLPELFQQAVSLGIERHREEFRAKNECAFYHLKLLSF